MASGDAPVGRAVGSATRMSTVTAAPVPERAADLGRTFARNDLARSPVLERFIGGLTRLLAAEGYIGTEGSWSRHARRAPCRRRGCAQVVPAQSRADVRHRHCRDPRAAGRQRRAAAHRLPVPRPLPREPQRARERHPRRSRGALRDARAGHLRRRTRSRRRRADRRRVQPHRTARVVAARHRQRLRHRPPRAALGRRRIDAADAARGPRARCARSSARSFPARGDPAAARFAAGATALRDRRPLLRERERALHRWRPARRSRRRRPRVLDERERRRQGRPACHR